MLPDTHFAQFLLPRLAKARTRLEERIWRVSSTSLQVERTKPTKTHGTIATLDRASFQPVKRTPLHWGRLFDQCWWRVRLPVDRKDRYLAWRDEGEATIYVDGVPHYGIDPGHHHAPLPDGVKEVIVESLCARTGVWVEGEAQGINATKGSRFDGAFLAERDDDAWDAWHDLDVLMRVMELLPKPEYLADADIWGRGGYRPGLAVADPLLRRLIHRVNEAIDVLDRDGAGACHRALTKVYKEFPADPNAMTAVLTGHAHIDLVWLWPERAGDFKAVHSFANALSMIERYPEATFGYSQPASYEAVARRSPELDKRVRRQVRAGHWEPTGAMYVESDVQLPCGEALVRAFALGQAGFRDLRGSDSRCVWLPDVFGYTGCLPTIMAGFGVPYFYTTKLHWSGATRFPYSSFRWVGMDGSEVVAHISWYHYNQRIEPDELKRAADQHRQSHVHDEALFPCGFGDGGGGLTESMCERSRRLSDMASLPRAQWGTIEGFFDRLDAVADRLPAWHGEMYLEYHRGVQTTHGRLKSAFRAAERGLQVWEAVRCATGGGPVDEGMWKRVCFAQFHDYIPGSSIAEVYEEAVPELEGIADDALRAAAGELAATGKPAGASARRDCVFNPLPVERDALIDGRRFTLPPLAGVPIDELSPIDAPAVKASKTLIDNGVVRATFNAAGEIKSLRIDGHELALDAPAAALWTFADIPAMYDAWDIDRYTLSNGKRHRERAEASIEQGDGRAAVRFSRSLGELGTYAVTYALEVGNAVLAIDVDLDLKAPRTLAKLVFPTRYRGREARYGAPFGSVRRPQWEGPLTNDAMFENPASRWAAVCDDDERDGLMLATESKYGFGAREGLLHLSLARSARITPPNIVGDTTRLGPGGALEQFADLGPHHIRLAVGRYVADAPRDRQPAALADALFTPVLRYRGTPVDAGLRAVHAPPSLTPCWAVPERPGAWTLRLHETLGSRGELSIDLADGWRSEEVDLRGLAKADADSTKRVAQPYELLSFSLKSSDASAG